MKKLGLMDDLFLRLESRRQPLHIGILMLFEPPAGAGREFTAKLADRLRQSSTAASPFNRCLVQRGGLHYWEEDQDFDLEQHFVHLSLPQPGRIRELLALVSRVHCAHLDRAYPLWRMYLIEGLEDGRIAVYMKIHHSVVDGVAGMRLLLKTMSTSAAESKKLPPPWEVETKRSGAQPLPVPNPAADSVPALRKLASEGLKSAAPVWRELRSTYDDYKDENPNLAMFGQAPQTLFNQKISATRRFAAQSYATPRMRAVAEAYDATLNDVVIAMCAGALRKYLLEMGELPRSPLTAAVPVSLRRSGSEEGNEIAFTITTLATHLEDPAERLRAVKKGMDYNKERLRNLSPGQLMAYTASMMIPGQLLSLAGLAGKDKALANVIISHVPGPRRPMYWQGAKLSGLYPISLNIDGGALNITLVSRQDYVDFGLIACRKNVPHMQRLLDYLEDSLVELEKTVKPAARKRPGKSARRAAAKQKSAADSKPAQKSSTAARKTAKKPSPGKPPAAKKRVASQRKGGAVKPKLSGQSG